jgi:hypothetical protein
MNRMLLLLLLLVTSGIRAQDIIAPPRANGFTKPTTYDEITSFISSLDKNSGLVSTEIIARSVVGRNLYAVKFSSSGFGNDPSKTRILIFAQQHGNEQSGKEGALLLIADLLRPENRYLFRKLDIAVIPQMNPDGSEGNRRRNGDTMDLNRNHLILTEPETIGLHHFFDRYLFDVTVDVHEYFPYGETWKKYGYRNNTDLLLGTTTNSNVSVKIRELSNREYIPFMNKYLPAHGVSDFIYSPGGPPEEDYIRHSTFDINDGRQSFGIQNTLSFIHEGLNGTDGFSDNLRHRAESQMYGMRGLIEFSYLNSSRIRKLVDAERKKMISDKTAEIAIQSEHLRTGKKLNLPLLSLSTGRDTIVIVNDYRPVVGSVYDVSKPSGYLIPTKYKEIKSWIDRHGFLNQTYLPEKGDIIERYEITTIDSIDFEGDKVVNPSCNITQMTALPDPEDYIYLPTAQLKGDMIVIALEPKSMLGLVTYREFAHLLSPSAPFPILRIIRK